jgi:hypothetical protein
MESDPDLACLIDIGDSKFRNGVNQLTRQDNHDPQVALALRNAPANEFQLANGIRSDSRITVSPTETVRADPSGILAFRDNS